MQKTSFNNTVFCKYCGQILKSSEPCKKCEALAMDEKFLVMSIYDKLMDNNNQEQFNAESVEACEVDYDKLSITFYIDDIQYQLKLNAIHKATPPIDYKYNINDEVMNTTGYRCFIEARRVDEDGKHIYTVSTAENHDLCPSDDEDVQVEPSERWELGADEIDYKIS